jgi:hypothetical protein
MKYYSIYYLLSIGSSFFICYSHCHLSLTYFGTWKHFFENISKNFKFLLCLTILAKNAPVFSLSVLQLFELCFTFYVLWASTRKTENNCSKRKNAFSFLF